MSADKSEDVFDDVVEDQEVEAAETEVESATETEKPAPRGYMSKEAWIEAGRDPEEWVSPEVFKERGERIKMKMEMQRDFENRLKNISIFHQKQLSLQREELLSKRDDAIDIADKETVKKLDKQLKELDDYEELNKEQESAAPIVKPQEVLEWEDDNPWCRDPSDPRLPLAQRVFSKAIADGKTPATALRLVDKELAAKFIDTARKPAQIAEGSRPTTTRDDSPLPSMKNLTAMERKIWDSGVFDSEKDFLKAVADDRKAGKK